MFAEKSALLLDMNGTFMFGHDRFDATEDFSVHHKNIGGTLPAAEINRVIRAAYQFLDRRYTDELFRDNFPSIRDAINAVKRRDLSEKEICMIIDTFSFHELGYISDEYMDVLLKLRERFELSAVIDIWSPKKNWVEMFESRGINKLFSASSFSSDRGMVKPSPKPFEIVVNQLNIPKEECLVIGDSPRRDLGGAYAAGIDCVLVGDATDARALGSFPSLLELCDEIMCSNR